jgi:hypothetical protein
MVIRSVTPIVLLLPLTRRLLYKPLFGSLSGTGGCTLHCEGGFVMLCGSILFAESFREPAEVHLGPGTRVRIRR